MMDFYTVTRLLTMDLLLLGVSCDNKRQEIGHGTSSLPPQYEATTCCTVAHIYAPPQMQNVSTPKYGPISIY
jgi:hypothetical protein